MGSRLAALLSAAAAALLVASRAVALPSDGPAAGSGVAHAEEAPHDIADRLMREAEAAAQAGDRLTAASRFDEVFTRFPSLRVARLARIRSQQLRALQTDPEPDLRAAFNDAKMKFAERGAAASEQAIRALAEKALSPALQQDIELWLAAEEARTGRGEAARNRFSALLRRETLTPAQAAATTTGLLRTSETLAERADARREVRHAHDVRPAQLPSLVGARLLDEADDRLFSLLAWYASIGLVLSALLRFGWALRQRSAAPAGGVWRPSLLFPLYAFAGAGLFAESWEHGRLLPFLAGGAAVTAIVTLQRLTDTRRPPSGGWRFVTAAHNIGSALAALYLVLYAANLQHLIGL